MGEHLKVQQQLDILVVDDWLDTAESLAELIRIWGFEARTAFSGPSALAAARVKPPDVVIMDIGMPQMDGLEAARLLRQEHDGHPMHLIAVTGHGVESTLNASIDAEFDQHLVKPADPEKIFRILNGLASAHP